MKPVEVDYIMDQLLKARGHLEVAESFVEETPSNAKFLMALTDAVDFIHDLVKQYEALEEP